LVTRPHLKCYVYRYMASIVINYVVSNKIHVHLVDLSILFHVLNIVYVQTIAIVII